MQIFVVSASEIIWKDANINNMGGCMLKVTVHSVAIIFYGDAISKIFYSSAILMKYSVIHS